MSLPKHHPGPDSLIFVHIPKTGGTSLANALRVVLPEGELVNFSDNEQLARFRSAAGVADLPHASVYVGHLTLPEFRAKGLEGCALTIVRPAIDRIVSMYRYLATSEHPDHAALRFEDPAAFLDYLRKSGWYPNVQCRMIAGRPTFEEAVSALEDERVIAVTLDDIDLLAAELSTTWPEPLTLPRHNVSAATHLTIPESLLSTMDDLVGEDHRLVEHVAARTDMMLGRVRSAAASGRLVLTPAPPPVTLGDASPSH